MRRFFVAAILMLMISVGDVSAQALNISGQVPIFCRDSTGAFQPMQRTNYQRLKEGFIKQFGWRSTLTQSSSSLGVLTFGSDAQGRARERIYYDVQPYNGGIALLHMHVRLNGHSEDLTGTPMCLQTFGIINIE